MTKKALYVDSTNTPIDIPGYEKWVVVKNYDDFTEYIENNGIPDYISFEHDLAEEHVIDFVNNQLQGIEAINYSTFKEKTGYDCALWLCDYISEQHEQGNNIKLNAVGVHSNNPGGTKNILHCINNYKAYKGWEADAFELKPKVNEVKDKEIE
jgi:hypothetical protein